MPPSTPPARCVRRPIAPPRSTISSCAFEPWPGRGREPVAELHALHGLDAHQREGEAGIELAVVVHVRTEAGRAAVGQHLEHAAQRCRGPSERRRSRPPCARRRPDRGSGPATRRRRRGPRAAAGERGPARPTRPIRTTWETTAMPELGEERLRDAADRDARRRLARARALQDVADVVEAVLLRAHEVRVPRPGPGELLARVDRPLHAHQLAVLRLELRVGDRDGDRRAQGPAVPDAGEDLEPVGLEPLPPAAPVAVPAACELLGELLRGDRHAGGHALEDGDERLPVGLPGREHPQHGLIIGTGTRRPAGAGQGGERGP